jgi:hypothetical protein
MSRMFCFSPAGQLSGDAVLLTNFVNASTSLAADGVPPARPPKACTPRGSSSRLRMRANDICGSTRPGSPRGVLHLLSRVAIVSG